MMKTSHQNQSAAVVHRSLADIWIVGGGPSLKGFDFNALRGNHVMCCNDTFLSLPWADSVVSLDRQWIRNRVRQLEAFAGRKYLCHRHGEAVPEISDAVELEFRTEPGLSHSWEYVHGSTTGYAALNIAVLLGYRNIGVLGFDYYDGGHWHDEYDWTSATDAACWRQWAAAFTSMVPALRDKAIRVINYNPRSAISAFSKQDFSEIGEHYATSQHVG